MCRTLALLLLASCRLPAPTPTPEDRASALPVEVCARSKALGCRAGKGGAGPDDVLGTDDDVSCEQVFADLLDADPTIEPLLRCTAAAQSCAEAEACAEAVL
jgi:hypothetical protein